MKNRKTSPACALAVAVVMAAAAPATSNAQAASDDWSGTVTIYGWVPTMGGTFSFPLTGTVNAQMDPSDVLDALNFAAFVTADVRKDRWGAMTDVIYLDLGGTKKGFRDIEIDGVDLPAQLRVTADVDLSGWVWTLGGTYLAVDDPAHMVSLVAGARLLDLTNELTLKVTGDIAGTPLPGRQSRGEANLSNWDAIVGVKGRFDFGETDYWFVPYYVDVGTGESDYTWQAVLGLGYAFDWGAVTAAWRYLDYDFGSEKAIEDLWQSGAAIGVTFTF